MIKVVHVIKSLELGGAETVLRRLVEGADPTTFQFEVISLTSIGPVGGQLLDSGFEVKALQVNGPAGYARAVKRMRAMLSRSRPAVVQTWMYHADLVGGLAARLAGCKLVWGLHAGSPPLEGASVIDRAGLRLNAGLSYRLPKTIICCSETTARVHAELGFDTSKMMVVPNGFEVDPRGGQPPLSSPRDPNVPTVLRVGRDHPDKDIPTFLAAVRELNDRGTQVRGVLAGPDLHRGNRRLVETMVAAGVADSVDLLGPRDDVPLLIRAADVAVSSSSGGEGFPLVIGEAMAAGTPVVGTDVGDSALVIDDPQRVVPPRDPNALADAIQRVLALDVAAREAMGARDRAVIKNRWSLENMIAGYCDEYQRLAGAE